MTATAADLSTAITALRKLHHPEGETTRDWSSRGQFDFLVDGAHCSCDNQLLYVNCEEGRILDALEPPNGTPADPAALPTADEALDQIAQHISSDAFDDPSSSLESIGNILATMGKHSWDGD